MGVVNFGVSSSGNSIFSRLKPYPTPNIESLLPTAAIPVVRSGNKNYFLPTLTTTTSDASYCTVLGLYSTNPNLLVQATDFTVVTAGAKILALWLSSVNQAMYVVYKGTDTLIRLSTISDTTGAVTHLGSGFTPATPANWPSGGFSSAKLEGYSGNLRLTYNGFSHVINITTGDSISEDSPFMLAGYSNLAYDYATADGSIYSSGVLGVNPKLGIIDYPSIITPRIVKAGVGVVNPQYIEVETILGVKISGFGTSGGTVRSLPNILIDDDKIAFTNFLASVDVPIRVVLRSNYDDFLLSIANWGSGL